MLTVVLGDRYEELVPELVERLAMPRNFHQPLQAVVTPEWVVTPSLGVRRWLTAEVSQRLGAKNGRSDGIVANWQQDFPSTLIDTVLKAHLDDVYGLSADPWSLPQLQFALVEWAEQSAGAPGIELLLGPDGRPSLTRARQVADLFDRYFTWRHDMVCQWAEGKLLGESKEEIAQSRLFQNLRSWLEVPSPPERWNEAWAKLPQYIQQLPVRDRISIFGLSSFPGGPSYVKVIHQLAELMDVTIYQVRPFAKGMSPTLDQPEQFATSALQMWGASPLAHDAVLAQLISCADLTISAAGPTPPTTTMLGRLQKMLREDVIIVDGQSDTSIVVHEGHGDARQCDILRDAIRHELNERGDLRESEILVVCPDVRLYEPLIRSAFGTPRFSSSNEPQSPLAYRIVDPSIGNEGFYLQAVQHLLQIVRSRCTRTEVLGFLAEPQVLKSLGVSDASEELFDVWTKDAGVRWGLNLSHRRSFGLDELGDDNTWRTGLQRLRLGAFIENPRLRASGNILPVEVAPGHFDDLVALVRSIEFLTEAVEETYAAQRLVDWFDWYDKWTQVFIADADDQQEFERVNGALQKLRGVAEMANTPLRFWEFVSLLNEAFESIGSLGAVLTGGIIVTSPETLRGVSFRSIYIVGFDEEAFNAGELERHDLRRFNSQPGDVTPVGDARSRLRDVILAAQERLTIIRSGRDVTSNNKVDPCVALSELFDALAQQGGDSWSKSQLLTIAHPRNSFSPANFDEDAPEFFEAREKSIVRGPWSFSQLDEEIARHAAKHDPEAESTSNSYVGRMPDVVSLEELKQFLDNPPRTHARVTLGISIAEEQSENYDDLETELAGLGFSRALTKLWEEERAAIDLKTGLDLNRALRAMEASGDIPPTALSGASSLIDFAEGFASQYRGAIEGLSESHISIDLAIDETKVVGDLEVFSGPNGIVLVEVVTSRLRPKALFMTWLRAMALSAHLNGPFTLALIHRPAEPEVYGLVQTRYFEFPLNGETAVRQLKKVLDLYRLNLSRPIPYGSNEPLKYWNKPKLTPDAWTNGTYGSKYEKYLGNPEWFISLGHLSFEDIEAMGGPGGHYDMYRSVWGLLDDPVPLMKFIVNGGGPNE